MLNNQKKRISRILLWGWYGYENLGDDLLLDTMLQKLHGDITVPMKKSYALQGVKEVPRSYRKLVTEALKNDVLIIGPGGLFPFDNKRKVLLYYILTGIWKALGRKVIFFGIGISEEMSNFSVVLWKKMARRADLFIPRSMKVLNRMDLKETETIHSMADVVFASELIQKKNSAESNRVMISVANLKTENEETFRESVQKWVEVVLIAFTKRRDDEMIKAIMSSPKISQGGVRPIYYKEAVNAVSNWNQYKFAICMRFHSLVLSILAGVPAVPIAYGHKTFSLAEMCGLRDYTLIWNAFQEEYYGEKIDVSSEQILQKISQLLADIDGVKSQMISNREKLVDTVKVSFIQILNAIDQNL